MTTSQKIIIAILLLAVIVLGLLIYKESRSPISQDNTVDTTGSNSETVTPVLESKESALTRLKATQNLVAANPWPDQVKMKEYSATIDKLAVNSNTVEVNYCAPMPSVLHLKVGQSFTLKNSDSVFHKLNDDKFAFEAPSNSEQKITPNFSPGIYFLRCDEPFGLIIWVTP